MVDNTKEITELEARAKALRTEKNRRSTSELGELEVQEAALRRQVAVAKKGMEDANRAVERAHTQAADMEKYATELDKAVEKNEITDPKQAAEDREQAEYARSAAMRAEQQARAARAEADEYRTRHAELTTRHEAAARQSSDVQSKLGRAESLGIDQIEEKARLLRASDELEKSAASLEQNIGIMRDRNVSAKTIKESEGHLAKMRAEAAKAEADAAKVKINEEIIKESGLETPVAMPPPPVATADTSLLDDEAGLVAQATASDGAIATNGDGTAGSADDIVGDGSVDEAVAAAEPASPAGADEPQSGSTDLATPTAADVDIEPAAPAGVPIPFPNEVEAPAAMADASADLAGADAGASLGAEDPGDVATDVGGDAGLDPLEA